MSIEINVHDCVEIDVEEHRDGDIRWTEYVFKNVRGHKVEVNVYHRTARQALKGKLLEFVKERT